MEEVSLLCFFFLSLLAFLRIESRALCMVGQPSTIELHPLVPVPSFSHYFLTSQMKHYHPMFRDKKSEALRD